MNKIKRIAILTVLLLIAAGVSFAQNAGARTASKNVDRIKKYLEKLDEIGYSGSVLIALNGKPVLSRGFGFSDAERKIKNSPNTVFDIGSVTKQFTAAAVLKLEMQGKLSTADKIAKYFRNVPPDKADITIHQLLRHSAGLPSVVGGDFEKISEAEFVEKVFSAPLRFPAGTRFSYSNVGYSLLALIVEKVSGQSYERYLYENLWKPAGMETTGYTRPRFDENLIAVGYRTDEQRWGKPTEKAWDKDAPYLHLKGNGGVLSTTGDLFKWDRALLSDAILSKEAKEKYYRPPLRADETGNSIYAYGWEVTQTERNTRRVWHNGTNRIFFADFYRFIDEGVTIVLMTNKSLNSRNDTGRVISEMIFDANYEPVVPIAETAANRAFTDEIITLTLEKGLNAAVESYRRRDKKIDLLESVSVRKGFDLIEEKRLKEAIEIFKLNVFAFPKLSIAFEGLGEAYLEAGDEKSAIENYKKSLLLNPKNENAREALKRLEDR
ncbi:MAG TPA: serine hydrolase [Pyrinomonadaceae bacterium]|jgi:CubicO group peptidase (beta-lactamase class C family)